jgi:hypothetical protein
MSENVTEKTPKANSVTAPPEIQIAQQDAVHGDVALDFLKAAAPGEDDLVITKESTARVLRKVDMFILPILA